MNLGMLLEMAAGAFPERVAVTADDRSYTYDQLLRAAHAAAHRFRANGARYVALLDTHCVTAPIALFGAAFAGIPYVPLNYRLTASELEALLLRIAPAQLIAAPEYVQHLVLPDGVDCEARAEFLAAVSNGDAEPAAPQTLPEDIAVQLFTSGTTGTPKAAVLHHANLMAYILGTIEFGSAANDDATLVTVPPYHIAGISAVLSSTYACRRTVLLPNFDAGEWLRLCADENISNAFLVPTMLARVVDHLQQQNSTTADFPQLRAIAYGGGKMPLAVMERAMALFPAVDFTNAYGLTETSSTICLLDPDAHRAAAASGDAYIRKRLASVGRPIATIELQIRGDDGSVLPADQIGDVYVRGEQVSGEYVGLGSLLDADGWFPTRDRGYLDIDGFLFLDGRTDDVIVRGGENISPGEIEEVLLAHPAVADAAVVAITSEQWGEAVAAVIVPRANRAATVEELQRWVRERLRSSRVPELIIFREQLPCNEMGKVLRRVIRQELQG